MELNTEQIGIRTTKTIKSQFEAVEGATSNDKLKTLIEGYLRVKNALESEIIDQSVELLGMLKVNLGKLENVVNPNDNLLKDENEKLRKELELLNGKYDNLNKEYSSLIVKLELKGIKI